MPTKKNKYRVTDTSGANKRTIEAESYTFDETTGRHIFRSGDEIIANLVNVNIQLLQD